MQTALTKGSLDTILIFSTYALIPLYLLPSGSVQLVDVAIVAMVFITFINITADEFKESFRHAVPFIPFAIWSLIVNTFYTISNYNTSYMIASVELIYTLIILVFFSVCLKRLIVYSGRIDYMLYLLLISCIFTMVVPSYRIPYSTRVQLSFNNPNQLAYYSVLILTSIVIVNIVLVKLYRITPIHSVISIICIILADTFAFVSASRAGVITSAMLSIIMVYIFIKRDAIRTIIILTMIVAVMVIIYSNIGKWPDMSRSIHDAITRFTTTQMIDENDLDNRWFGYLDYKGPYSLIFGDGGRFRPEPTGARQKIYNKEVHNSVLWNFLAYGIVGGLLLLAGAAGFYRQMRLPYKFAVLLPLIVFNMSLYGLRFRLFWVTMALMCAASSLYSVRCGENIGNVKNGSDLKAIDAGPVPGLS